MQKNLRTTLIAGVIAAWSFPLVGLADTHGNGAAAEESGREVPETSHQEAPTALGDEGGRVSSGGDKQLHALTAGELQGKKVVDASGEDVGRIAKLVSDPANDDIHVVLEVGGEGTVTVPFDEFRLAEDDELIVSSSREKLLSRKDDDGHGDFVDLEPDERVSKTSSLKAQGDEPAGAAGEQAKPSPASR